MPHIKVSPFNTEKLESLESVKFRGYNISSPKKSEIILFFDGKRDICFDIIKKDSEILIKPNKVTRSSDIESMKRALNEISSSLNLNIIQTNTVIKPTKVKPKSEFLKDINYFYNFKSDFKKIKLEIGFGSGRHLLYRAKEEPNTLFIGIEIHTSSINQVLKQINLQDIKNIIVVSYDARLLLEMLPSNILDKIYVHFPVPWDKKPHRRVISKSFIKQALRVLKKGASIELRTDSDNYYNYSLEVFASPKQSKFNVEKNIDIDVTSKYEQRWKKMNKDIYTLTLFSLEESKNINYEINFNFDEDIEYNIILPNEPIVKDDYFVHFGKVFKSFSDEKRLLEVSFGNFNMPEKKMIYLDRDKSRYIPSNPVKSLANFKADKLIKKVLKDGREYSS